MPRAKRSPSRLAARPRVAGEALARSRRKLLDLEAGGSKAHPLEVSTSAVIEPKALGVPCPRCGGAFGLVAHEAHLGPQARLREVKVACRHCGERRTFWFRIHSPS
jgi:hypothetical protein